MLKIQFCGVSLFYFVCSFICLRVSDSCSTLRVLRAETSLTVYRSSYIEWVTNFRGFRWNFISFLLSLVLILVFLVLLLVLVLLLIFVR